MTTWTMFSRAEWAGDARENAEAIAQDFRQYLEDNRDEIEALTIFFSQPHRRRELTYAMIREVFDRLKNDQPRLPRYAYGRLLPCLTNTKATNLSAN